MPPRLIVTADDFGWSPGVNEAVAALYDERAITAASLMVGGPAAAEAARLALERPGLAVGLHVATVCAPALLAREAAPHLVDREGRLPGDAFRAGLCYTLRPALQSELGREVEAQFKTFDGLGLGWSHVDFHVHMGLTPAVFEAAASLCGRYPVAGIRVPEDDHALYRSLCPAGPAQRAHAAWFRLGCRRMRRRARELGLRTTRWCYGFFRSGRLDADYLSGLIRRLPDADVELHCHPDLSTPAGRAEFEALRSHVVRAALAERGVQLTTFAPPGSADDRDPQARTSMVNPPGAVK
jgi:hopanoid biosynthesis associated protein HpnK